MNIFVGKLFHSLVQSHIMHLQTTSFAKHTALAGYYGEISGLIDSLVESYQGKYGIIKGYEISGFEDPMYYNDSILYFDQLCNFIIEYRPELPTDNYIQNILDDIEVLVQSTKYKLKNLK